MKRLSGQERRAQIVDCAYAVILEKGLAKTATRDVTRHLGVGSGLLHHYFKTWGELRAEVVKTFISKEIATVRDVLAHSPPETMIERFVDSMVSDPEFRFWRLWLDAVEEARRDLQLAAIVREGHVQWHATIVELIDRATDEGIRTCENSETAAWRISALADGLMGMLSLGGTPMDVHLVRALLHTQIGMELSHSSVPTSV